MIKLNREKAEPIILEALRAERAELFPALDVQFTKALEAGSDTSAIAAERQALRDITKVDLSSVPDNELSSVTVEVARRLPQKE